MKYRWALRSLEQPGVVEHLQQSLNNLPHALARTLVLRGIETFEQARLYFRPSLDHLHDPFLMQDMDAAANRVVHALRTNEHVLVYGDYDVDGTTSTALMTHFLRSQGARVSFFIPDRIQDGYGLVKRGIDHAKAQGASLIIALDCGITAHTEAQYIREQGLELIICDHHTVGETIPDAVAVLDPKRPDCAYPFKELCGCGVGFKLLQAVLQRLGQDPMQAHAYLDLVAIATASDIVPLHDENRVLMREGFQVLSASPRLGIRKLAEQAQLDLRHCTTSNIVFSIGPRINAAGRLGDAMRATRLLITDDDAEAHALALELEKDNERRRHIDRETVQQARTLAEQQLSARMRHSIVLHDPNWHSGVVGIVASRLIERFYRPTILLTTVNGIAKGSARSIAGVNIYDALKACSDLLIQFGGHDYAAGLSLEETQVPAFQKRFDEVIRERTSPDMLLPIINIDADLTLGEIDQRFWAVLKQFAPFGPSNRTPVFKAQGLEVVGEPRTIGANNAHIKFRVKQSGVHRPMEVIGFNMQQHYNTVRTSQTQHTPLELVFSVDENHWKGRTTLQLRARDLQLSKQDGNGL